MIIKKRHELPNKKNIQEKVETKTKEEKIDLFDLDNIDFSQRQERRRGDRRRGYRRIDDRNLISRAQEEAGIIRDNAAKEGYNEGLEKAKGDIQQITDAIQNFLKAKQDVFEYIAPDILEISIDIARKIVKHEIEQNPEIILNTILDVLKTVSREEPKITIKVNPAQLNLTRENIPEIVTSLGLDSKINVIADDTIELGSCIVKTNNGIVDATVNTQLAIIKEAFKGM
ncbi:MAG: FliH/SctL family protein [Candidatus Gastranaerophilales bacterium]|nr:FliH/SctL family protein [Candidatus Gastranaerophilales bacterium]